GRPSPLTSPTATALELVPVGKSRAAWKAPSPLPSSTLTEGAPPYSALLATARPGRPLPVTSDTATEWGLLPAEELRWAWKVPSPLHSNTLTLPWSPVNPALAMARSKRPSPLTSQIATEWGLVPAWK